MKTTRRILTTLGYFGLCAAIGICLAAALDGSWVALAVGSCISLGMLAMDW